MGAIVATMEAGWLVPTQVPVLRLRRRRARRAGRPAREAASRALVGAGLGAVCGAATLHLGVWMLLGAAVAVALGRLRDSAGP